MGIQNLILKDKRGLEFKSAFFAVLLVGLLVVAIGVIVNEWNTEYNSGLLYDLDEFNKIDNLSSVAGSQRDSVSVKSANTGEQFEDTSIRGVFGILSNIYAPFRIVFGNNGMIDSVTERFGIPDYIRITLVAMMFFAITFTLVAIFFKLPRSSA